MFLLFMKNRYKLYPEINFGVAKLDPGVKIFEDLISLIKEIRNDKDFQKVYFEVTDLRGCNFNFDRTKLETISTLMDSYQDVDNQKLGVYIVDKPMETAYVQIFFNSIRGKREICSTPEKAYQILNLSISLEDFKEKLEI